MEVFRIADKRHSDLSGKGGIFTTGRWHVKGFPVVYTAGSRSLAMLERYIHEDLIYHDSKLVMLTIHIDDDVPCENIQIHSLPDKWSDIDTEHHSDTQKIGTDWLSEQRTAILQVPSAIVPQEKNVLINPFLIPSTKISIVDITEFTYDQRYLQLLSSKLGN